MSATPEHLPRPVPAKGPSSDDQKQLQRIREGLRLVTAPLPYLSGLAAAVRVSLDDRVPTMGVFASGRMIANAAFAKKLSERELVFVLAHELLHLALRTHDRARGSERLEFNYAHDYIINDILREELGFTKVPAGGLDMAGARHKSAEEIVLDMRRNADRIRSKTQVFDGSDTTVGRMFGRGQDRSGKGQGKPGKGAGKGSEAEKGDTPPDLDAAGDVLDERRERELFPNEAGEIKAREEAMKELAAKGLAIARASGALKGTRGLSPGDQTEMVSALRGLYQTPWRVILQRWMEAVAPGERTFSRPSRRGEMGHDIVLPGRRREGWMLNLVLDTSGSMSDEIPRALGAIADFCDAVGVDQVRIIQCDVGVTVDELVEPGTLATYRVS
ncbi:MAG TPA: hypothetical protein PK264_13385, partial [Hyphomicrobiaceae bacterium]|nr:hypothetical protein [Hyphomicrobiaceae bacterium]